MIGEPMNLNAQTLSKTFYRSGHSISSESNKTDGGLLTSTLHGSKIVYGTAQYASTVVDPDSGNRKSSTDSRLAHGASEYHTTFDFKALPGNPSMGCTSTDSSIALRHSKLLRTPNASGSSRIQAPDYSSPYLGPVDAVDSNCYASSPSQLSTEWFARRNFIGRFGGVVRSGSDHTQIFFSSWEHILANSPLSTEWNAAFAQLENVGNEADEFELPRPTSAAIKLARVVLRELTRAHEWWYAGYNSLPVKISVYPDDDRSVYIYIRAGFRRALSVICLLDGKATIIRSSGGNPKSRKLDTIDHEAISEIVREYKLVYDAADSADADVIT